MPDRVYRINCNAARKSSSKVSPVPLDGFYQSEDYHKDYALKNPNTPYIEICDRLKIRGAEAGV